MRLRRAAGLLCLLGLFSLPASADQNRIPNYRRARVLLWTEVYPNGGETLYCGVDQQADPTLC